MPSVTLWKMLSPEQPGERVELAGTEMVIGRSVACDYRIPLDLVSRMHIRIQYEESGGTWKVVDLHSRNGTFLNEERVYEPAELKPGDTITLGAGGPKVRILALDPAPEGTSPLPVPVPERREEANLAPAAKPAAASPPPPVDVAATESATRPVDDPLPATGGRRGHPVRYGGLVLLGAAVGFLTGLQIWGGLLPAQVVSAPGLFLGISLVKAQSAVPAGLLVPLLMAVHFALLLAAALKPWRGWVFLAVLLALHAGAVVLIRTEPDAVGRLLSATAEARDRILSTITGRP